MREALCLPHLRLHHTPYMYNADTAGIAGKTIQTKRYI